MGCCEVGFPEIRCNGEARKEQFRSWINEDRKAEIDPNLGNILMLLKNTAIAPCDDRGGEDGEWVLQMLSVRKTLFVIPKNCARAEDFPYRKRRRNSSSLSLSRKRRRSKRILDLEKFGDILSSYPFKRIPTGVHAQADVPYWIDLADRNHASVDSSDDSRWLGTTIWPVNRNETAKKLVSIGKGRRDSCRCVHRDSIDCVKLHLRAARRNLKSNLGQVFFDWNFQIMGEEVSKSWTVKEQAKFDEIVKLNPESKGKCFFDEALKQFTGKLRRDIVRYYFNVYVLRWIRSYTRRLNSEAADSDDNGDDADSRRAPDYLNKIKDSVKKHSNGRYLNRDSYKDALNQRNLT